MFVNRVCWTHTFLLEYQINGKGRGQKIYKGSRLQSIKHAMDECQRGKRHKTDEELEKKNKKQINIEVKAQERDEIEYGTKWSFTIGKW